MTQHSISPKLERDRSRHDTRRVEQAWASWYRSPIWKSIRRHRLAEEPQCRECAIEGRTIPANQVDHIEPHRGEWSLFMQYENTQSLCRRHHNAHRYQERSGKASRPPGSLIGDSRYGQAVNGCLYEFTRELASAKDLQVLTLQFVVIADLKSFEGPELQASVKARISANALR